MVSTDFSLKNMPGSTSQASIFSWPIRLGGPVASTTLFWCLLAVDIGFLLIHLSWRYLGVPATHLYSIGIDLSHPEFYQYTKEAWIALVLLLTFVHLRRALFLAFSVLYAYLLFDDAIAIHELVGEMLVVALGIPGAMIPGVGEVRGQDFAELLAVAIVAVPAFAAIAWSYFHANPEQQEFARGLVVLTGVLAFFGVVVDFFVHAYAGHLLFFIEDGGEMIAVSAILWFVFRYHITACERHTGNNRNSG